MPLVTSLNEFDTIYEQFRVLRKVSMREPETEFSVW